MDCSMTRAINSHQKHQLLRKISDGFIKYVFLNRTC